MTPRQRRMVFAAALVPAIGGALAAQTGTLPGASSEGTAGEAMAQAYHDQNRARFAASVVVITSAQTAAARAEGEIERPHPIQPHSLSEGDAWTLPGRFVGPE